MSYIGVYTDIDVQGYALHVASIEMLRKKRRQELIALLIAFDL